MRFGDTAARRGLGERAQRPARGAARDDGPLAPKRYAWGTVTPYEPWSDAQPSGLRSAVHSGRPAEWLWPASFEMRSWSIDPQLKPARDDIGADVFMFADSAQARDRTHGWPQFRALCAIATSRAHSTWPFM